MIERCLRILHGEAANLDRLLAITFTEKAAAELKARLRHVLPPKTHHLLATAWVSTFHGFCARVLRSNAPLIGLDPSFGILDENAFRLLAQEIIRKTFIELLEQRNPQAVFLTEELDFQHATSLLEELIDFRWHAQKVLKNPPGGEERERLLYDALSHCEQVISEAISQTMNRLGSIDFQELEIRTLELLKNNASVRDAYQRKFEHILVDEYQDTSDIQSELVFLLANPKVNKLMIVGDPRQSIYRFRGANVHCFEDALRRIRETGGEVISLNENFRSEPALISFVNATFTHLWDTIGHNPPSPMIAARENVHMVPAVTALLLHPSDSGTSASQLRTNEADALASHIKTLVEQGTFRYGDITCLFQAMTTITEYETLFKKHFIPYRFYGGRGLLERQEIRDLIFTLRYAVDPKDDVALLGLLRSPLIGFSDDECARMAGPDGERLREAIRNDERVSLLGFLEAAAKHLRPSEILESTIDRTGYEYVCALLDPSGGMQANIDRLITLAKSIEEEEPSPLPSFVMFLTRLRERSARLGDPPAAGFGGDAVSCMTVHTAKGLEFPVVILADTLRQQPKATGPWRFLRKEGVGFKLKDWERPFGERRDTERFNNLVLIDEMEAQEELKRLLYVAMTRARDLLIIPVHAVEKSAGKWHEWLLPTVKKAPANELCQIAFQANDAQIQKGKERISSPAFSKRVPQKRLRHAKIYTVSELESFDRCPHEYYLKYVLGLPANDILADREKGLAANVRGSIIHGIIEKYDPLKKEGLDNLIKLECFEASVTSDHTIINDIKKVISNFENNPLAREAGRREVRFDWRFHDAIITGSIDWLRPVSAESMRGFEIVDFKTDSINADEVATRAREYDLQLVTYALAARSALGLPITATTLYFLEPNILSTKPMDERRIKEGKTRITAILDSIMRDEYAVRALEPPCYRCPFRRNKMCSVSSPL